MGTLWLDVARNFKATYSTTAALVLLVAATLAAVVLPVLNLAWAAISRGTSSPSGALPPDPILSAGQLELLAGSAAWAAGIAAAAVVFALPAAWALRKRPYLATLLLVPLVQPNYLAYAGLNLLRAPHTLLGDWVERLAQAGMKDAPLVLGRVVAFAGLSLWVWPLAAITLGGFVRSIDDEVLESARLETRSPARRMLLVVGMLRRGLLAAWGAVFLVMLGSAVPLHVAQVRTLAMAVWVGLVQTPGDARAYVIGWPLVAVAMGAGWWLAGRFAPDEGGKEDAVRTTHAGRGSLVFAAGIWGAAVVLPLCLFGAKLHEWSSLRVFWLVSREAVMESGVVAACVGGSTAFIGLVLWFTASVPISKVPRAVLRVIVAAWFFAALAPGVLIGQAWAMVFRLPGLETLADSPVGLVLAHIARFGAVPVLVALFLVRSEPAARRDARVLDGGGVKNFVGASLPRGVVPLLGAGFAAACMSLHEIEAAVMVQSPGTQSLAQLMIGYLHFAKIEELSAGSILLVGGTGVGAIGIALMCAWATSKDNPTTTRGDTEVAKPTAVAR